MSFLTKIFGDPNAKVVESIRPIIERINELEPSFTALTSEALRAKTHEFKKRLQEGETIDDLLPEAFAVIREAARRTLGQRHFDVQLIGGAVLHRGQIAEMRTGEGKTLTATAPLYLNALTGKGAHLVTVNDYLAKFHAEWMGPVYDAVGLTVGCIQHDSAFRYDHPTRSLVPVPRREAYAADVTYGTNNEFGFDYLRDNMVARLEDMVQRKLHYAIVDEVDSILIDEARTPLIISAPAEESTDLYYKFADLIKKLEEKADFNIDEKMRAATLTAEGIAKLEKWLGVENIYTVSGLSSVHHIEQALRAETLYKKDRDYVVKDGEIIIVDEFTGRLMFGRRYSEGLHQAIEAKEGVEIQRESQTLATITFQNYFRLYEKLAGMTGTAETEAEEFHKIYKLEVVVIPTHKPMIRADLADRIYKTEMGKFTAVMREVKERHERGQPVLIGTISIEKNETLSALLETEGIPHEVLNAKNHEREAQIITEAGRRGAVTLATNMAGRGVDIILGGTPPPLTSSEGGEAIADHTAQEQWQKDHEAVVALGGLHVIGTERHESRRIDNQLRGRAGRQGDPGSSQFYVSLDDDLMRIFGSERIRNMMERLGVPEDMPIENRMVSKALESAQHKVEGHNFDIRKYLVEYDDVINKHREVVYGLRRRILEKFSESKNGEADILEEEILGMIEQEIEQVVGFHTHLEGDGDWNIPEIIEVLRTIYPVSANTETALKEISSAGSDRALGAVERTKLIEAIIDDAKNAYGALRENIKRKINDPAAFLSIERSMMLRAIDTLWIEHLEAIDHLRQGIGLRGYGQRDPLVEYKREAYRLFQELLDLIRKQVVYSIYKISVAVDMAPSMQRRNLTFSAPAKTMSERSAGMNADMPEGGQEVSGGGTVRHQKIGRNEPCPCGSGKKYKRCHGA
ncbi:preprotein translocase subunit SecA [Candidatus Uhrbacteria bacterium RIFCSPLOWO2_12_FULL_46_10]|uniref:Protein translocase subunit SecA n=1 Tax=Candidatus Uhrbacteria bacterium RIFCSPLOWO2_01_FULL_47_25 TaxID=1802402 RepID=A0A1F7UPM4_9BACT|nr:MAG: Protein translocase subunit SecA [Parcubacteria group bacterium GW2011_GWA2_46_9]OGL59215.1 MAG: preprotein translocase subunit SecA [Candidatus Uhrbacteria bacterium RIFCSPHIGHO2_01_FULL_46_23]OGL69153.1 MAG: preprotein translocase subunit SecA [Candidatus Uhrbacteria bacterium RIFCSPHIGHO2_02_FULL_47_29]OGL75566.1 MAG: preprotein translocase subunit SecA [Candidatus Uhrbacteria bacterium RIFCSPHIGHO2_12_FULL_46_13]OGL80216.1 MAG: preprotein translocase subunit SecA [Candidatus Uhrbact